jgi:hypothetical protein
MHLAENGSEGIATAEIQKTKRARGDHHLRRRQIDLLRRRRDERSKVLAVGKKGSFILRLISVCD